MTTNSIIKLSSREIAGYKITEVYVNGEIEYIMRSNSGYDHIYSVNEGCMYFQDYNKNQTIEELLDTLLNV